MVDVPDDKEGGYERQISFVEAVYARSLFPSLSLARECRYTFAQRALLRRWTLSLLCQNMAGFQTLLVKPVFVLL